MTKRKRKQISLALANLRLATVHVALAVKCINKAKQAKDKRK